MKMKLSKEELAHRVRRLMSGDYDEKQMVQLFQEIADNVPCPSSHISDYIFHAKDNPSPEVMVERMLEYKPILL